MLAIIASFLQMLHVSRLSQVCRRLRDLFGAEDWKRAVFVPCEGNYMTMFKHPNLQGVESLILARNFNEGSLHGALAYVLKYWMCNLKFLMICTSGVRGLGSSILGYVMAGMECVVLEQGSLNISKVEGLFIRLFDGHSIKRLVMTEQRHLGVITARTLSFVARTMSEISLPLPGSSVDGITRDQLMAILLRPGRLQRIRLVSYWDVSTWIGSFEVSALIRHLRRQREDLLGDVWRADVLRAHCMFSPGISGPVSPDLQIQQVLCLFVLWTSYHWGPYSG